MMASSSFHASPIAQVIDRIYRSGRITRADEHHFLRAMIAENPLSQAEQQQVRDVFNRLQMGLLRVVD